jgi:chemotaxis protein histidine kinase CheA
MLYTIYSSSPAPAPAPTPFYSPSGGFQGANNFGQKYGASTWHAQSPQIIIYGASPFILTSGGVHGNITGYRSLYPATTLTTSTSSLFYNNFPPTVSYAQPVNYPQQTASASALQSTPYSTTTAPSNNPYEIRYPNEQERLELDRKFKQAQQLQLQAQEREREREQQQLLPSLEQLALERAQQLRELEQQQLLPSLEQLALERAQQQAEQAQQQLQLAVTLAHKQTAFSEWRYETILEKIQQQQQHQKLQYQKLQQKKLAQQKVASAFKIWSFETSLMSSSLKFRTQEYESGLLLKAFTIWDPKISSLQPTSPLSPPQPPQPPRPSSSSSSSSQILWSRDNRKENTATM